MRRALYHSAILSTLTLVAAGLLAASGARAQVRRPLPVVERLQPTSGPPGTEVTLFGRHFHEGQSVWLGDSRLDVVTRSPSRWTVRVPTGAQSGRIQIRTRRSNVRGPRFRVTRAPPAPSIRGFSPSSGSPGQEVALRGEHFAPRLADNEVHLGQRAAVVRRATPTELTVLVPSGAESAPWRVSVSGAGEATSESSFEVEVGTAITGFEPAVGPPRTRVTISGTGFSRQRGRVRAYLGEQRARVLRASETELTVEVPRRNARSGRWRVQIRGGGEARSEGSFEVRSLPTIGSMEPAFGAPGTRVTLSGEHFGSDIRAVEATIGQSELTPRDISDERLVLEVPEGASTGRIEVTVAGLGPARTRRPFRVTERVSVTGMSPSSGPPGTEVTISGAGFSSTRSHDHVTLSGQPAEVVRATDEALVVRVPDAASGPLVVSVDNAGQARTSAPFVVTHPPAIEGFSPASGPPGTEVTIRGSRFGERRGLLTVRLGEREASIRRVTDGELTVVVPEGASSGRFSVSVRLQGTATASRSFRVTPP